MSERYSRLFTLPKNLYSEGSPVIIAAGALLKDNTTGNVLVQLKIRNIGNAVIKAAKIKIQPFDTLNKKLGDEIGYTYLDLSVPRDGEFGQKTLVPLPNNETRGFEVRVTEIAFKDNTVWKENGSTWAGLHEPEQLDTVLSSKLIRQYRICYGEKSAVRPMKEKDLWHCACGAINHDGEPCHTCGKTYAELTRLEWEKLKTELEEKAEVYRKDEIYASGIAKMTGEDISNYEDAIRKFQSIPDWKDSNEQIEICRKKIDEIKANREASAKKLKRIISIAAIAAAIAAAVSVATFFLVTKVIIPNSKYNAAVALMNSGDYKAAITAFEAMGGYKDSAEQKKNCEAAIIKTADLGNTVYFGTYEQDNNTSNGKEDIEWIVLDKEGANILVISKYALDCQPYNTSRTDVTWESCTLRNWLNEIFLNEAFSSDEAAMIATTTVTADKNPNYSTNAGNDTQDRVFLLSIIEAEKYFSSDDDRMCVPTAYAIAQGACTSGDYSVGGEATCCWWLRSPGDISNDAALVDADGSVFCYGNYVDYGNVCVRPALWINLDS